MGVANLNQMLVRLLSNIIDAYTTALFVVDLKNRQFHLIASHSLCKNFPEELTLSLDQSGILSQVHKVSQTIKLDKPPKDITAIFPFYPEGESYIKGVFAVPVAGGSAVLYIDTKKSWGFNDKEQKWIRETASILHELLERQTSLAEQEEYAHILELWYHLDKGAFEEFSLDQYFHLVVEKCSQFLGVDYGFLASVKKDEDRYNLLATTSSTPPSLLNRDFLAKQGLIGWVLQNQKPFLITKLNPDLQEHYLFLPGETLPHVGTFWGLPIVNSSDHVYVLAFLARESMQWSPDEHYAISHAIHFLHLVLEQVYWRETCERMQTLELSSGIHNTVSFESNLEDTIATSMKSNTPFTLALVQYEPWQILYTKFTPVEVRQWQQRLISKLSNALPEETVIGQITENRYALLIPAMTSQEAHEYLLPVLSLGGYIPTKTMERISLLGYLGRVTFPQEGTRSDKLWPLVYKRLFDAFHDSRSQKS